MGIWVRLSAIFKRFGPVIGLTALSQLVAAVALILVPIAFKGERSDLYALGIQTGSAGISGIVVGVVYNLAVGRRHFARWGTWSAVAGLGTVLLSILTICYLWFIQSDLVHANPDGLSLLLIYGFGGGALALGATFGVRAALQGRPSLLAGATLVPNAVMILATLITIALNDHDGFFLVPAACWASTALIQAPFIYLRSRGSQVPRPPISRDGRLAEHALALALGAITSMLLPNLYFSAVTQLDAGMATWVLIVGRVGAALVGLLVNSVLLVKYDWSRERTALGLLPPSMTIAALVTGSAGLAISEWLPFTGYILVAATLFFMLVPASIILREINARTQVSAVSLKVVVDIAVSIVLLVILTQHPSISGYFGILAASQATTITVSAFFVERSLLRWVGPATMAMAISLVVFGW